MMSDRMKAASVGILPILICVILCLTGILKYDDGKPDLWIAGVAFDARTASPFGSGPMIQLFGIEMEFYAREFIVAILAMCGAYVWLSFRKRSHRVVAWQWLAPVPAAIIFFLLIVVTFKVDVFS